jgi:hypothetical protein
VALGLGEAATGVDTEVEVPLEDLKARGLLWVLLLVLLPVPPPVVPDNAAMERYLWGQGDMHWSALVELMASLNVFGGSAAE